MSNSPFVTMQQTLVSNPDLQVPVTFTPATGTPQTIYGVFVKPPMMEQLAPVDGATVVYLFVAFTSITPNPQRGDDIKINGSSYNVENVEVDRVGGAVLRLGRYI
jgi:hypothetical protein